MRRALATGGGCQYPGRLCAALASSRRNASSPTPTSAAADGTAPGATTARQPQRTLYPRIHLRADTQRPPPLMGKAPAETEVMDEQEAAGPTPLPRRDAAGAAAHVKRRVAAPVAFAEAFATSDMSGAGLTDEPLPSSTGLASGASAGERDAAGVPPHADMAVSTTTTTTTVELSETQNFLEAVQQQVERSRLERNQAIPYPTHPDELVPLFRRVKRHTKMQVVEADANYPTFPRKDAFVALPPPRKHPWVKNTPIGHIVHGDGQLGVVGTGEVGFEDARLAVSGAGVDVDEATLRLERRGWRGLQHRSLLQRRLPQRNGKVLQDAVIKHSFALTGRGIFATRDVKRGETIMIVESTSQSLGVKGEIRRLEDMVVDVLRTTYEACYPDADDVAGGERVAGGDGDGDGYGGGGAGGGVSGTAIADDSDWTSGEAMKTFLHEWILSGQPSSLMEHFPVESTQRVLDGIGGRHVLDALELHTTHIARLAAIMDLNSFLVESFYAERKGMAYFPEAGFLNHSCEPNATYDIMPEHVFKESDYYLDEAVADERDGEEESEGGVGGGHGGSASGAAAAPSDPNEVRAHDLATSNASGSRMDYLLARQDELDLTESGAMRYLFCCRAEKDIAAGSEILISYVPPGWSFDNRQYVLHDRYRFWCKCPKCAPTIDKKHERIPKFLVGIIIISIALQGLVLHLRSEKNDVDEELQRLSAMSEEERIEELRSRGIDLDDMRMDAKVREREERHKNKKRMGLLELMEQDKLRKAYQIDGAIFQDDPLLQSQNPYPTGPPGM